jgi:adenosylcobinamide kinase/adenosylcobinamide-phosphate guanylyltransferase
VETVDIADTLLTAETPLLLDCLGTWLTARMDLHRVWDDGGLDGVHADIDELVSAWRACPVRAVAVSNEVGSGVVPPAESGRLFRDLLGVLNARIAAESDEVVLMVAGRPLKLPAQ